MYEVYLITCAPTGMKYVGYTRQGAAVRFRAHLDNCKSRSGHLPRAIVKYGKEAFSFEVLWTGETHAEACAEEIRLIAELGTLTPAGYNLTHGGDGVPLTREQYEAIGAKKRRLRTPLQVAYWNRQKGKIPPGLAGKLGHMKGKKQSPEWIAKRVASTKNRNDPKPECVEIPANFYITTSPRVRKKLEFKSPTTLRMTKAQRRFAKRYAAGFWNLPRSPMSADHREALRLSKLGKPLSEETKAKLRAANLGKKLDAVTIEKIRTASSGRRHSEETKAKMSAAQRGRKNTDAQIETHRSTLKETWKCEISRARMLLPRSRLRKETREYYENVLRDAGMVA